MTTTTVVIPGQILGQTSKYISGTGTHIQDSNICASIAGFVSETTRAAPLKSVAKQTTALSTLSVSLGPPTSSSTTTSATSANSTANSTANTTLLPTATALPSVSSTVLARVTRTNPRQATVEILVVEESVCVEGWQGLIRVQDIRATEKDKVRVGESFRAGDVVRGVVISLGDQSNYYLSTAKNDLGVIMATSEDGNAMVPVSWKEFRDPVTGKVEARKVAKMF